VILPAKGKRTPGLIDMAEGQLCAESTCEFKWLAKNSTIAARTSGLGNINLIHRINSRKKMCNLQITHV